jgi:hypothetical protein
MDQHIDVCKVCGDFTLHDHPGVPPVALRWEIRENDFMDDLEIWEGDRQVAGHLNRKDAEAIIADQGFREQLKSAERQFPDFVRRMGDDLNYWRDLAERAESDLKIATDALREIGSQDYVNGGSDKARWALESIEGTDEEIGEALERQRQPEN